MLVTGVRFPVCAFIFEKGKERNTNSDPAFATLMSAVSIVKRALNKAHIV